jgi:hypothetical protein
MISCAEFLNIETTNKNTKIEENMDGIKRELDLKLCTPINMRSTNNIHYKIYSLPIINQNTLNSFKTQTATDSNSSPSCNSEIEQPG